MDNENANGLLLRAQQYRDIASSLRDDRVLANIIRIAAEELEERAKEIELHPKADVALG